MVLKIDILTAYIKIKIIALKKLRYEYIWHL